MQKRLIFAIVCLLLLVSSVYASSNFIIKKIEIVGLQGISKSTVYSYLPVKPGDHLTLALSNKIIENLYKTSFFDDVQLEQDGDTLIVKVVQRPIISRIIISGNKKIPTDKLKDALKHIGFSEGAVFNPSILEKIKGSLASEYFALGKYNAKINVDIKHEERNRVAVNINISEGIVSKIHQILIIGNHAFDENTLLKQFTLTIPGLLTWYTHDDQYSKEKLAADLDALTSYYMDRGFMKFRIDSTQVLISPDRQSVYIVIHITEGSQYKIGGYSFSGRLVFPKSKLDQLVHIKQGDIFSRKIIIDASKTIKKALGNKGYANAQVNVNPKIDEKNKQVYLNFDIYPGQYVYIRHITFSGNYRTNDNVLRREMKMMEGGLLKPNAVDDSKRNLLLQPFIKDADVKVTPVAGHPNLTDVNYDIKEWDSTELQAGIGYSQIDKFTVNASVNQRNVLGTGNTFGFHFMNSSPSTSLSLDYYNPYSTLWGIGRDISLYGTRFNSSNADISDYDTNDYGLSVSYNIPVISANNSVQLGYGYENTNLDIGSNASTELNRFVGEHGRHFYQLSLNSGWTYQSFDRYLFPTKGWMQNVNAKVTAPFSSRSLEYYKLGYSMTYYHPLYQSFIGKLNGDINYGNGYGRFAGDLPFFKNYYAGGMGSVRGFQGNSLGPKDSKGDSLGGNFELDGSAGLVLPNFVSDTLRTTLFIDAGNVYKTDHSEKHYGINLNELRYSTGVELDWRAPIGLLNFSLAAPLHKRDGDDTEIFEFNVGTSF